MSAWFLWKSPHSPRPCLSTCWSLYPCSFLCCSALKFSPGIVASSGIPLRSLGWKVDLPLCSPSHTMHQHDLFTALFPYQMMHSLRARAEFTYMLCITPNRFEAQVDRCLINIYWVNKGCSFPMFFFPNLHISLPLFSLLFPHQNQPNIALYCETRIWNASPSPFGPSLGSWRPCFSQAWFNPWNSLCSGWLQKPPCHQPTSAQGLLQACNHFPTFV